MIHASLCTGIGACELAATWIGWDNAFSCEIDAFCQRVLKYYYPNSKHYGNIFETDFTEWRGKIDVLTAGFPCQPFSCAGSRKGAEDDRYLWPEVLRVIGEVRPAWFIGENVAGITSMVLPGDEIEVGSYTDLLGESYQETEMRQQFVIDRICNDLESIGYSVQPIIIPACTVGAPHRRDRIWFIAHCTDARSKSMQQRQNRIYEFTDAAHSKCFGGDKVHKKIQSEQPDGEWADCISNQRNASDPKMLRCAIFRKTRTGRNGFEDTYFCTNWRNFPTQSPICCRNDGIPCKLSGITVPKHRIESIKSLGNTMVPQVVYQIFKAIAETEKHSL